MKAKAKARPKPKAPARHTLTLRTATVPDRPRVRIERLKGGEIVWQVEATAPSLGLARERAIREATILRGEIELWHDATIANGLKKSLAAVTTSEAMAGFRKDTPLAAVGAEKGAEG